MRRTPETEAPPPFEIEESFWGYVIRSTEGPPVLLQVAQGLVLALGAALTAGALLLVVLPVGGGDALSPFHAGLATLLGSAAALLLWFATRGSTVELQVDLLRGELREAVRHRAGRPTVLGRHGLDSGATLSIHRGAGAASLILRFGPERPGLCIARGPEGALLALRRRLEEDLLQRGATILRPARAAA